MITIRKKVPVEWQEVLEHYTDEGILNLYPDGDSSLVNPLLRRAQAAEQEVERLREELKKSACRYCPLKLKQEEKEARR